MCEHREGRKTAAGRSCCSSPHSKLGQRFQGFLTTDSSSFVTRLVYSPDLPCDVLLGPGRVWIASGRGEVIRRPSLLAQLWHYSRKRPYVSLEKFILCWIILTKIPVQWWVNAASPFCEPGNQKAEMT